MKKRIKSRAVTVYVDPRYERQLNYLKYTTGVTSYIESCLDKLEIDELKMQCIEAAIKLKEVAK